MKALLSITLLLICHLFVYAQALPAKIASQQPIIPELKQPAVPDIKIPNSLKRKLPTVDSKISDIRKMLPVPRPQPQKELLPFKLKKTSIQSFLKTKYHINKDSTGSTKDYFKKRMNTKWSFFKTLYQIQSDTVTHFKMPKLIKFNGGQAGVEQQMAQREGLFPNRTPADFTRFTANFGVSLLGIPLKVQALQTTEQDTTLRQPMNRIAVSLDLLTWKNQLNHYVDDQLKAVERQLGVPELKKLDKLYRFYQKNNIKFLDEKAMKKRLSDYALSKSYDSLDTYSWKVENKAGKKIKPLQDKIENKAGKMISTAEKKVEKVGNRYFEVAEKAGKKVSEKAEDLSKRKTARVKRYLKKNKMEERDLTHLQHLYDSVSQINPEKLELYETYLVLKSLKDAQNQDALAFLKKNRLISFPDRLLASIKTLTVGTSFPTFSDYTLKGMPIKGAQVELQIDKLYLAYAGNTNLQRVSATNTYERKLWAVRTGWGTAESNHIRLTLLKGEDISAAKPDTVLVGLIDTAFAGKPRQNYVIDVNGKLLLSEKVGIEGELARSATSLNHQLKEMNLTEAFGQMSGNPDTQVIRSGWATHLKLNWKVMPATTLSGKWLYIGSNFFSLGVPFIRNNQAGYEVAVEQKFLKNQITFKPSYARTHSTQGEKVSITTYGLNARLTFSRLPQITIDYRESLMQSSTLNRIKILMVNTHYPFKWGKVNGNANFNYSVQENITAVSLPPAGEENPLRLTLGAQFMKIYTLQPTLTFSFPLQLTGSASIREIRGGREAGNWKIFGGEVGYTAFGVWQSGVGISYGNTQLQDVKQSCYFTTSVTPLKKLTLKARVEKTSLQAGGENNNSYSEMRGIAGIFCKF
jgi:vacuolar-type H+-ATPase subunit H